MRYFLHVDSILLYVRRISAKIGISKGDSHGAPEKKGGRMEIP